MPSGVRPSILGAHGVEIDEPRLEQRLGDGFERGVGFAQEGDAVVEGTKRSPDFSLRFERWRWNAQGFKDGILVSADRRASAFVPSDLVLQIG